MNWLELTALAAILVAMVLAAFAMVVPICGIFTALTGGCY